MLLYWVWLSRLGMSDRDKMAVLDRFGSAEDTYFAENDRYRELSDPVRMALLDKNLEEARQILAQCEEKQIRVLCWGGEDYPSGLRAIADPPLVLYVKGQLPDFDAAPAIGVVGTRKASVYGLRTAKRLGSELAACGALVVSGMAAGIDTQATEGALSQGKCAVGVLGCGVDRIFPASNRALFAKMEQQGCLISEFAPGTPAYKWNFPRRTRIISGLSNGVLVVEAPKSSGALITARQALEQGRDVFVVPGNVDVASCEGSNGLLREGASMAATGWDVLSEYAEMYPDCTEKPVEEEKIPPKAEERIDNPPAVEYSDRVEEPVDDTEAAVLRALEAGRMHMDLLADRLEMSPAELSGVLILLEIKGLILSQPGGWVCRV